MKNIAISKKINGIIIVLFLAISVYMMRTTTYTRALGDYVLEFFGLNSWSGNFSGIHVTIIYFGILTIILLGIVLKLVVDEWEIRKRWVVLLFVIFTNMFSFITDVTAKNIKKNLYGVQTIGFNSKNSKMEYKSNEFEYSEFNAEIELVNYGDESKEFYITIDNPAYRQEGFNSIDIFTKNGDRAVFTLDSNETEIFRINLNEYKISGGRLSKNGGGRGAIKEIILTDQEDNKIKLDNNNFFGVRFN